MTFVELGGAQMRVLKREDIAPGAAKVALTGQRCTEWPPLQVDPNTGVPTMEDMGTLGARIDQQGPFRNYHITWPGSRVPVADLKEVSRTGEADLWGGLFRSRRQGEVDVGGGLWSNCGCIFLLSFLPLERVRLGVFFGDVEPSLSNPTRSIYKK